MASNDKRTAGALTVVGLAAATLAFYVVLYPLRGFRVGLGSDTPVYVWWGRHAASSGIGGLGTGARPLMAGLLATLATLIRQPVAAVAPSLAPVMAAALGLCTAVLVAAAFGRERSRFALVAGLTGAYLALLVPGYLSTLAFGEMFVAALAVLADTLIAEDRPWRPATAAAVLIGAAGLAHALFLFLAAAVLAGALTILFPSWWRSRHEVPLLRSGFGQVAASSFGGLAAAGGGLVLAAGGPAFVLDTSRDALLRRIHLPSLVTNSYLRKLHHDFPWWRTLAVAALALTTATRRRPRLPRSEAARLAWGALAAWLAVTIGAVVLLFAGVAAPAQRLAAFCLPLPVLAATGLHRALQGHGVRRALAAAGVVLFVVVAWLAWGGQQPLVSPTAVAEARTAGHVFGVAAVGTQLVLVMDVPGDKPSLFVTRAANYLLDEVPAGRVPDVRVFVGSAADYLLGRVTLTGQVEHDRMATDYFRSVFDVPAAERIAVEIKAFDPNGYAAAANLPGAPFVSPGVAVLPGAQHLGCGLARCTQFADLGTPGAGPFSPWLPVWLAPLLLLLLTAVGLPWARAVLPSRPLGTLTALAPAFGLAAIGLASIVCDAAGLRLGHAGGFVAGAVAFGAGLLAARLPAKSPSAPA